jgi:hypothetical protein
MIRIVLIVHPAHTPLAPAVAIALLRSPVATELDILSRFPILLSRLIRLPRTAFWLNRRQLWRVAGWRIFNFLPLSVLTATVDDEGHLFAVLHRLDDYAFSCRFDVSDLRIAC